MLPEVNPFPKPPMLCKHQDRIPYAKGKCKSCYVNSFKKQNKRKADCHPDKAHVAKGKCLSCYNKRYNVK